MSVEDLDKLYSLNQLMALATGSNQELVIQIKNAIDFSLEDGEESQAGFHSLTRSAEQMLKLHMNNDTSCGFEHCDLRDEKDEPLFIRARVLKSLRLLSGYDEAILLISGLRQLACPDGKRRTAQRKNRYREWIEYIESLAAQHSSPKTNLRLIFL